MNPVLSIIMVTFNHEEDIPLCLQSLLDNLFIQAFEIVVVDNHSQDQTIRQVEKFQRKFSSETSNLKLVRNSLNLGFTKAVNQGLNYATGRFVLLLNPDTQITNRSIDELIQFLSNHPSAGAVAPQLVFPDDSIQPSCRRFPRYWYIFMDVFGLSKLFSKTAIFNGWKMGDFDHQSIREVKQPQGSCLLVRKSSLEHIGNLDDRFFMFFSDVDLCKQIYQQNETIFFYPKVKVYHKKGSSVYSNRSKMIWQSHKDFILYFLKWYRTPFGWICNFFGIPFLIFVGIGRWSWAGIRAIFKRKKAARE
jgi:GT2 family glycosyltransferase